MTAELRAETKAGPTGATGAVVVRVDGEVDASNVDRFRQVLEAADQPGPATSAPLPGHGASTEAVVAPVVVVVGGLSYLDSAGVNALFDVARRRPVAVVAPPGSPVRRVLDVVSLGAVAAVYDSLAAVPAAAQGAGTPAAG